MVEGLFVLGTSHRVSAIPLRERLQTEAPGVREALARLTVPGGALEEAALLATCGRFEIYGVARHPWRARRLLLRLARKAGVGPRAIEHHDLYFRQGASAAEHLFRVAGGLDSAVRGEAQILGQVRGVLTDELDDGTLGPKLLRLFQSAVACGKRVRAETKIGRGAASLAGAALQLLRRHEPDLTGTRTLVLGAGDTGRLAAHLFSKAGCRIVVANRTLSRASDLAAEVGGEARCLEDLPALLRDVDLVVGTVAGRPSLVGPAEIAAIRSTGGSPPRYFLDLAHPRNFDPELSEDPGTFLMDLEVVHLNAAGALEAREAEVPKAEAIVAEEVGRFEAWYRGRPGVPRIRAVREQVLSLAQAEADRQGRGLQEAQRERLHQFARSLARTILHRPTVALREADPATEDGRAVLHAAQVLFGVGGEPELEPTLEPAPVGWPDSAPDVDESWDRPEDSETFALQTMAGS